AFVSPIRDMPRERGIMRAAAKVGWEGVEVQVGPAVAIPLLGTVAAGVPFHAFPVEGTLELPAALWGGRTVFALRARGSSLIEQRVGEAEAPAAARTQRSGARLRELARNLRALRDCYLETTAPRLRAALLREAGEIIRRLGRFGAERSLTRGRTRSIALTARDLYGFLARCRASHLPAVRRSSSSS